MSGLSFVRVILISVLVINVTGASAMANDDELSLLERSRAISTAFGQRLQAQLQAAMAEGGPIVAVTVCKDEAPKIASALSRETGAKVRRTSLRYRNPANAPEPWEAQILRDFEKQDAPAATLERLVQDTAFGTRYMRAIPTAPLCLACHGEKIQEDIGVILDQEYPFDNARGYRVGDIRGAFSIGWPQSEPTQP